MNISDYLNKLEQARLQRNATEHTYRGDFAQFIESLKEGITATNEPKRSECGAPDFIVSRSQENLTLGYMEAKDIGANLNEIEKSEQLRRYLKSLPNLILTDYVEFRWYVNGELRDTACIARPQDNGKIYPASTEEQARALQLLAGFLAQKPVDINTAEDLALRLAHLTHLIRDIIVEAFQTKRASQNLADWRSAFAATLLPELAEDKAEAIEKFADMFAQTLTYGLFSARVATGPVGFSRAKAQKLIPRTNPFLRSFFEQITGAALDDEPFAGFVEDLIQTLAHSDMPTILEHFGRRGRRRDPVVHFYETFLQAYDPKLRELRGVYYTPEPVVNYIVQSIDALLKDKFGLKLGLRDHSKFTQTRIEGVGENAKEIKTESHRVLILDPATGTGTFLYNVLDFIRSQFKAGKNAGQWGSYVHEHLLNRLFGFELLMAPYAVAHFKLGLALAAWDEEPLFRPQFSYEPQAGERLNIFLTNTLEDMDHVAQQLGPLRVLSEEAKQAHDVKCNRPVLVVLGNPPYSNFGQQNRGPHILALLDDYKRGLGEKKINLNDDFIKFIRWAQWRIEQTGSGIIGYITNNVYLDGLTHRRMRECLLETFDEIHIVNLHGSSKKQEKSPDGSKDDNVFDITVGVAIVLFVKLPPSKKKAKTGHAAVRYADLWGRRKDKYSWLDAHDIGTTKWTKLAPVGPGFYFVPKNFSRDREYRRGIALQEIFPISNNGLKTDRDELFFDFDQTALDVRMRKFFVPDLPDRFREQYRIVDSSSYDIATRRHRLSFTEGAIRECIYRPFDKRWLYYDPGMTSRPAEKVMRHMLAGENLALISMRQSRRSEVGPFFVADGLVNKDAVSLFDIGTVFPLYLYPNGNLPSTDLFAHDNGRRPNVSAKFVEEICGKLGVKFVPDGLGLPGRKQIGPELIFRYLYAILHCPSYRERFAEFLRTEFPRLPLTSDFELFLELAGFGGLLIELHMRGHGAGKGPGFPIKGTNVIEEARFQPPVGTEPGRVWINAKQYFEGVPPEAWEMPIGGYHPAERWLKDRIGRTLGYDDQTAYARIVFALLETKRLMVEIDQSIATHGGWPLK